MASNMLTVKKKKKQQQNVNPTTINKNNNIDKNSDNDNTSVPGQNMTSYYNSWSCYVHSYKYVSMATL